MNNDASNATKSAADRPTEQVSAPVAAREAPLAPVTEPGSASGLGNAEVARLTDEIIAALKTVYDPEIPSDIYELGLIYKIDIADDRKVAIDMTLTTPRSSAISIL